MSLPSIKNYPTKKITLPISKKKVTIRGFVVKEEKILIMAREQENATTNDYLDAMCQIIDSCVTGKIDPMDLNEVDLSYLFLRIRMMSKGEHSKVTYKCKAQVPDENTEGDIRDCDTPLKIDIDLNQVEAYKPEGYNELFKIPNNDIHIKMRMPTVRDVISFEEQGVKLEKISDLKWEHLEHIIASCVESIIEGDQDESTVNSDFKIDEIKGWLEDVPDAVLDDIIDQYLTRMPYLRYSVEYKCPGCGTNHEFDIVGLENFFE